MQPILVELVGYTVKTGKYIGQSFHKRIGISTELEDSYAKLLTTEFQRNGTLKTLWLLRRISQVLSYFPYAREPRPF